MIDLITGHQGIPHISAEQISTLHRSLMGTNGDNKVVRMKNGGVTSVGLTVSIATGYWRVHGYDMQIQEAEAVIFDPTETGYQRIDDLFVEILQDISSGVQRSELVIVQGEPSAIIPTAPAPPTEAASEYDLLVECVPVCSVLVIEGAMTMTDLTIPFKASSGDSESLAPEFDPERPEPYEIGEIVEQEGKLYIFIRQHSGPWNDADVEETTVAALIAGKADNPVPINQGGTEATTADQARGHLGAASNTEFQYAYNMIRNSSSDAYSTTKPYKAGEYCIHGNLLYKCISPCTPGSWEVNRSHFAIDTIANALTSVNNDLSTIKNQIVEDTSINKSWIQIGNILIWFGTIMVGGSAGNYGGYLMFTDKPFSKVPHVITTPITSNPITIQTNNANSTNTYAQVYAVTPSGQWYTSGVYVDIIAIGEA